MESENGELTLLLPAVVAIEMAVLALAALFTGRGAPSRLMPPVEPGRALAVVLEVKDLEDEEEGAADLPDPGVQVLDNGDGVAVCPFPVLTLPPAFTGVEIGPDCGVVVFAPALELPLRTELGLSENPPLTSSSSVKGDENDPDWVIADFALTPLLPSRADTGLSENPPLPRPPMSGLETDASDCAVLWLLS